MSDSITRRNFLSAGAAAAAFAASGLITGEAGSGTARGANVSEDKKAGPPKLRKALKYGMIAGGGTIAEKFALAKSVGFEGVDVNVRLNHDEVKRAQDETGLIVHGVVSYDHWGKPLSHPDPEVRAAGLESFLDSIRDCKAYGGTTVLLVPGVVNKEISYGDCYRRSQAEIKKALPLAEELGIDILFENVWNNFLLGPVEAARYIDEFESKRVGAYFDVGNVVRYGWPEHWILELGDRIGKLDIKEYSRKLQNTKGPRAGFGVKLGEGDCDWPQVMTALNKIGFSGWATAEVGGGGEERLKEISDRMTQIFSKTA